MASAAKEPQAYFYLAHAEDICDSKGDPIQVDVPDKSVILQSAVCGTESFWLDRIVDVFGNPEYAEIFKHPFKKTDGKPNLELSSLLLENDLEVHAADINIGVILSKVYTIGYYRGEGRFGSSGVRTAGTSSSFEFYHDFNDENQSSYISIGPFIRLFRGSVKPTEWEVHEYLNFTHPESERFKREGLTEEDIFSFYDDPLFTFNFIDFVQEHPGIHYHLLCRNVPNYCKRGAAKRRMLSAEVHGHSQKALAKIVDYAKKLRVSNKIQDLENFIRTMTVTEIKSFFNDIMYDDYTDYYKTELGDCETRNSPVYLIKRIMEITKEDPAVYRAELIEAMKRCELPGDINELAEIVIKQEQAKKKRIIRLKSRAKSRSKRRSKSKSKSKSKSRSKPRSHQ